MNTRVTNGATLVVAACCILVTGIALRRERQGPRVRVVSAEPERVQEWQKYAMGGQAVGPYGAPVTIVEFADYQCPFCKRFHETLGEIRTQYPELVRVVVHHFPLERIHPHARGAALAAECAAAVGRFWEYSDALYASQDSIGRTSWTKFAIEAGLSDTIAFNRCVRDSTHVKRLREDQRLGNELRVTGTPTVLVNEWRVKGGAKELLTKLINAEAAKVAHAATVSTGRP